MQECMSIIELGLCVAQKEMPFTKLLPARDISPGDLIRKELGNGRIEAASNKRSRSPAECPDPSTSGTAKRRKANHQESESDSSDSSADEADAEGAGGYSPVRNL